MEHGHAHPSHVPSPATVADHDSNRQQTPNRPLSFLGVTNTSSPLRPSPQTPFETPLSLPQRRLQLRNAGFRAPRLPSHRLSTRLSKWFSDKDDHKSRRQKSPARKQENSPPTVRRRAPQGGNPPSSILQEITNSTRSRPSIRSTFGSIYEDGQDGSPTHSWYHDAPSTQQSPIALNPVHAKANEMKLREISGNARRSPPPPSSLSARQVRGRSKRGLNLHKTSFPASEHIVFLETQLEEFERSQYSPNTGLPLKDKVSALTAENNRLEEMLAELEHQFETRLRDSVEHKTGLEMNLRRRIKQLEEEIDIKDSTIQDLEDRNNASQRDLSNANSWKAAVERLESEKRDLEETSRNLEKRNDVLTELLGQSPTRSHHEFEFPSPVKEQHRRTPRPRSMMPRIPSSPARSELKRRRSLHTSPSPFQLDYFSPLSALIREHDHPCHEENVDPQKSRDDWQSVDSGLGDSCSVRSGNGAMSKRSSMHSYASASPAAWGLPLPPSPTDDVTERSSRRRKTRRFASGSTQLKPLVLPTLNSTSSFPQSAPLVEFNSSPERRDVSEHSIDPTIAFLSQHCDTPTQPMRRSHAWAAEDALNALEGTADARFVSLDEKMADPKSLHSTHETALAFQDRQAYPDYNPDSTPFAPSLIDEVIMEEGSTAFLSNQFKDAGDQSFSSLAGEVSMTGSDIDGARTEEQILTNQFLESALPHPVSIQLPNLFEAPYSLERHADQNNSLEDLGDCEPVSEPDFSAAVSVEQEFVNPLVSPNPLPTTIVQRTEASHSGERELNHQDEQEDVHAQTSLIASPSGKLVAIGRHSTGVGLQSAELTMPNPLKTASSPPSCKRPKRPKSPLEVLQHKGRPTIPMTSLNNRTIFGTVSRYTSYMREIRRDPTALARRVIANAWCSNWKRLGKLSWWVLGLFLGPGWKQKIKEKTEGWEVYDGENIAEVERERLNGRDLDTPQRSCRSLETIARQSTRAQQKKRVEFDDGRGVQRPPRLEAEDAQLQKCKTCEQRSKKGSWGKSLYLWGKFSVAIMLAVGGAVIKGPEEMMKDCDLHGDATEETRQQHVQDGHDITESEHNYSLVLQSNHGYQGDDNEDDNETTDSSLPDSSQTKPSNQAILSLSQHPPLHPQVYQRNNHYTFGVPSTSEHAQIDDNGQCRPSRSRVSHHRRALPPRFFDPRSHDDLGTLQWMQSLRVRDFQSWKPMDEDGHTGVQSTIRVMPIQGRVRTRVRSLSG
ncbi:hypothetical protein GJ744_000928 [Endocarpon pusillum]|uniref:Uncharacterized protein n=1 Tax=Endocarpon pusillum TaxID=364733 RepID=A0A8H7E821_9EURO|nr:hypothetical protein GJ744_000928 [Endocarpon pusillum]